MVGSIGKEEGFLFQKGSEKIRKYFISFSSDK